LVTIPNKKFQDEIAEKLLKIKQLIENFENLNEKIYNLLRCEIIS